jgi:8-oxo-dGTP pyrophosphatase MutT (NUDIX family)
MTEPHREYARRTARVLVVDGAGRVLLFRCHIDRERGLTGWFTPGGGVADGESLADAAVRELGEETGLLVSADRLGPVVAETEGFAELGWVDGWLRDDFFLCRVDRHQVDTSGFGPHERVAVIEHRWWTADELTTTSETIFPIGLGPLAAELAAGRVPAEPVRLPWHH